MSRIKLAGGQNFLHHAPEKQFDAQRDRQVDKKAFDIFSSLRWLILPCPCPCGRCFFCFFFAVFFLKKKASEISEKLLSVQIFRDDMLLEDIAIGCCMTRL